MTEAEKLIRKIKSDHKKLLKQYDEAIAQAPAGTGVHTRLLEAKSKANERHRAELVKFGLMPENLSNQTKTKFRFVSFMQTVPATDAELQDLLRTQLVKACKGRTVNHEKICELFEKAYPVGAGINKNCAPDEEAIAELDAFISSPEQAAQQKAYDQLVEEIEK